MAQISYANISFLTFQATLQVVFICLAGFWAAKTGLLNGTAQKYISRLNVDLFTPCLIFSKLAPSLSLKKLIDIFVIPIFFVVTTGVSFGCSKVTSRFMGLNEPESNFVTAMSVFGNSNSLPVSLTLALSYTLPNLEWEDVENDSRDQIASRGILYLLIFQQLGQVLRWSWGFNTLLRRRDPAELRKHHDHDSEEESQPLIDTDPVHPIELPSSDPPHQEPSKTRLRIIWDDVLEFMNPPLYAMLVSIIVASVPALQHEFFMKNGFINNTLASAIKQMGSVSIPLILIVLGSNLAPSSEVAPPSPHYRRMVFASLVARMILPSIVLLPLIALCVRYIHLSMLDDPIFLIVSFILTIAPPAIQLSQICQLNELYEMEMAGVLFWGYVVLTVPTTIAIVVGALEVLNWALAASA